MLHALLVLRCLVLLKRVEANNILRGADGDFGTSTHNAVIKFQSAKILAQMVLLECKHGVNCLSKVVILMWDKLFQKRLKMVNFDC